MSVVDSAGSPGGPADTPHPGSHVDPGASGFRTYIGRFAPSPTGPLHAGSLVAALASWLDARAHAGRWLVRIEDVDGERCDADMARFILDQLAACGLCPDEPPLWQSTRQRAYDTALQRLRASGHAYPCGCTRRQIDAAVDAQGRPRRSGEERLYPGTCRDGLHGRPARAWRFRAQGVLDWQDRRLGPQTQDLERAVGDFVLKRGDGYWAYQLAVVVDDAAQGITHIVRGEDLADNTARQIALQHALGFAVPVYLHTPLVLAADGRKLSKQNGAAALDQRQPLAVLRDAARVLGLPDNDATDPAAWRAAAVQGWAGIIAGFATRTSP